MLLQTGAIKIMTVPDADQVRYLDRVKGAGAMASHYTGRDGLVGGSDFVC